MRHPVRGSLLGILAVVLFATAGLAAMARESPVPASPSVGFQGPLCVGWCFVCDVLENKYWVTTDPYIKNDEDDNVACGHHLPCASECRISMRNDMDRVTRVVAAGDDKALRRLLQEVEGLSLNKLRRAIQLKGCGANEVVLHLPLSAHQAEVLSP